MARYVSAIHAELFGGLKKVSLRLDGKNLILVGGNACGKTQLINLLFDELRGRIIERNNKKSREVEQLLASAKMRLSACSKASKEYAIWQKKVQKHRQEVERLKKLALDLVGLEDFVTDYHAHQAVLICFDAHRRADIREYASSKSLAELTREAGSGEANTFAAVFEGFLVSHKTQQAYARALDDNISKAETIGLWFDKLQADLRELFEDASLVLQFNSEAQSFSINQVGKAPYSFQQLSSGFSSILAIYAELISRVELRKIDPERLSGVVFIDEIDVHLHVSLQRKIFSFLTKSFPGVQFIVSTHSPFVVSSVNNSVIYDMSRGEEVGDVSMYSYEALLEGLFGVLAVSDILKGKIIELATLTVMPEPNFARIQELVLGIEEAENKLDPESLFYLNRARVALSKVGYGG